MYSRRTHRAQGKGASLSLRWPTVLCVLCVFQGPHFLASIDAAAEPREVVPLEGPAFQGRPVSIAADGRMELHATDVDSTSSKTGGVRKILLNEMVRWGNPVAPRSQTIVVLVDGGKIVTDAAWAGGAAVKLLEHEFVIATNLWNEVRLPSESVSGVVFAPQRPAEEREGLLTKLRRENEQADLADVVALVNGDRLLGRLTELDREALAVETRYGVVKVPTARAEAILLGDSRQRANDRPVRAAAAENQATFAVGARDGSLVYARAVRSDEKGTEIERADGLRLKGAGIDDLTTIQLLRGPVVYLSDLNGADHRSVPYLDLKWPFTRDRNVLGGPIVVRGLRYLKGIGMHSAARLTYRFDGEYKRFDSAIAVDDSARGRGSVTFGVYVERDGKWTETFNSGIIRGGDGPQPISIDLKHAKGLTLTVDFADRGDELDHAVWLDARLVP